MYYSVYGRVCRWGVLAWVAKAGDFCASGHCSFVNFGYAGGEWTYSALSQVVANPQQFPYLRGGTGDLYHCNERQSVGPVSLTSTIRLDC